MKAEAMTPGGVPGGLVMSTPPPPTGRGGGGGDDDSNSCYFPRCRKDTNCHCEMCLASIHATRDLIPPSAHSSLTRLSTSKPAAAKKRAPSPPRSDSWTPPPTPETGSSLSFPVSQPVRSTAKSRPFNKPIRKERSCAPPRHRVLKVLLGLCLLWAVDAGVPALIGRRFRPKFVSETVMQIGLESRHVAGDLRGKLAVLEQRIEGIGGERVSNCSSLESNNWELKQGGHLFFHWRCVMYKSIVEEVSVWGSPLRSSGLIPTRVVPRSLTILSGSITEWSGGKLTSTLRSSNSSWWTCGKWSSAGVMLEQDTWVLEYRQSALLSGSGLLQAAWEMVRMRASRRFQELKQRPWSAMLRHKFTHRMLKESIHPT